MKLPTLAEARKAAVAVCGVIVQAVALGVIHGQALHYAQLALSAATALGVWRVPNAAKYTPEHEESK